MPQQMGPEIRQVAMIEDGEMNQHISHVYYKIKMELRFGRKLFAFLLLLSMQPDDAQPTMIQIAKIEKLFRFSSHSLETIAWHMPLCGYPYFSRY